jgi:hypothetical protein
MVLSLLLLSSEHPKQLADIRALGVRVGLPEIRKWNISTLLTAAKGQAIKLPDGWILASKARHELAKMVSPASASKPTPPLLATLRTHSAKLTSADTKAFLDEAIACCEAGLYRAAVVLSWVGAVSVLYEHVVKHKLNEFNTEAQHRDAKWRPAKNSDGLARMKEHDLLDVLNAISVLGKNVKQELQNNCLQLRNSCGHPNNFKVGEHRVAAHIETLIQNVFSKF